MAVNNASSKRKAEDYPEGEEARISEVFEVIVMRKRKLSNGCVKLSSELSTKMLKTKFMLRRRSVGNMKQNAY